MTDEEIQDLTKCPKKITGKIPAKEYTQKDGHERCDLTLGSVEEGEYFSVFIRRNSQFIENYSIGLRYQTGDRLLGSITLVRYNGPHGEIGRHTDGHYNKPHIHRITAAEMASGSNQPQEKQREITDRYFTFEEALRVFFDDTGITNWSSYFPGLTQGNLFNGHQ